MRKRMFLAFVLVMGLVSVAGAELQSVEVNGQIRIRGAWWDHGENLGGETSLVEQRTRLGVCANFTEEVKAVIEVDDYDVWGTDFRSNYLTGFDGPGAGADVSLYQAYIEASEMWGTPLRLRIGRQELALGSQWLIGVNDRNSMFFGLSFDAIRATWDTDSVAAGAIAAKLGESFDGLSTGDVDLYALYGAYKGFEDIALEAYWIYVHDHEFLTPYDVKHHTLSVRSAGKVGAFDYEAEAAYQFGDGERDLFIGDADIDVDGLGINLEAGYTFDMAWQPRVFLGGAYLSGPDNDQQGLFNRRDLELGFNRLFSNWEYTIAANTDESNLIIYRAGAGAMPTEKILLMLGLSYLQVDETAEQPWWAIFSDDAEDDLGLEVGLQADYHYSSDLTFRVGYSHVFVEEGAEDGNAFVGNGTIVFGGDEDQDFDYAFIETELKF